MVLCQICDQGNAKVHVTQIKDGQKLTVHLCLACAEEHGLAGPGMSLNPPVIEFSTGMFDLGKNAPEKLVTCPGCGSTFRSFRETGRLGCAECYQTFAEELKPFLEKLHHATQHCGAAPKTESAAANPEQQLQRLRERLQQAVAGEQFEEAVRLRDQIRALSKPAEESGA